MNEPKLIVLDEVEALHVHAAEEIAHFAGESICTHGEFTIALSGGSTPASVYGLLATRFRLSVDWKEVQFFWGDERCVPPDHQLSNYAMAQRTMLAELELRPEQVHRMRGELAPEAAAREHEEELSRSFSLVNGEAPQFDLILLGLGGSRHTVSLFPGDRAINVTERMVVAVEVDAEPRNRITFTPPVANNALRVMFIASGREKAAAVRDILEGSHDPLKYPAQVIRPTHGE